MRNLLAILAVAVASVAGVASAQHSQPMSYEAMAKAKQGAWAEYTMSVPGSPQKMTVRYAVVEKNEREMTMETDSQTPMGPMHSSMTFAPAPPDAWKLVKARIQMGAQPAQDVPPAQLGDGGIKKSDSPGKLIGAEKITVPAGTFDTKHYKNELAQGAAGKPGGMTFDVWMSDKAIPTGVVKMSAAGGIEMVLSSTGMGAKPKAEPKPESMKAQPATPATSDTAPSKTPSKK